MLEKSHKKGQLMVKKINLEYVFLIVVFGLLLWMGIGGIYQGRLAHDFPHGYMAQDSFGKLGRSQTLDQTESILYAPKHTTGGLEDVVEYYPPLSAIPVVLLHRLCGLELYDLMFFLSIFFSVVAALVTYLLVKDFNKNIAFISAGIFGFLFYKSFYIGYIWGRYPLMMGNMIFMAAFWIIYRLELKKSYLFLGILLGGLFLTHTPEYMFVIVFLIIYLAIKFLFKKFQFSELKTIIIAGIISVIFSIHYMVLLSHSEEGAAIKLFEPLIKFYEPAPYITDFSFFLIFILIGIVLAIPLIIQKKETSPVLLAGVFMLLMTYTNYISNNFRAFHSRYFWPIYLAIFFALGVYYLMKKAIKSNLKYWSIGLGLAFLIIFSLFYHEPITSPGLANQYSWDAFTWISKNTPEDSKIYFFYGDSYNQRTIVSSTLRDSYIVNPDDYITALNNKTIWRDYISKRNLMSGNFLYRKGMFSYGSYAEEGIIDENARSMRRDICEFDYYVFDKITRYEELTEYNLLIGKELLKNDWIEEVYSNALISILKNNKPGDDCIGE